MDGLRQGADGAKRVHLVYLMSDVMHHALKREMRALLDVFRAGPPCLGVHYFGGRRLTHPCHVSVTSGHGTSGTIRLIYTDRSDTNNLCRTMIFFFCPKE